MITIPQLQRALRGVQQELVDLGFWTRRMETVEIVTVLDPFTPGYYWDGKPNLGMQLLDYREGVIYISEVETEPRWLRDVLRHEYGHALAHRHPGFVRRNRSFVEAFGGRYDSEEPIRDDIDPDRHDTAEFITWYAATAPAEDFAETFMTFLRCKGKCARYKRRKAVYRKLRWVEQLRRKCANRPQGAPIVCEDLPAAECRASMARMRALIREEVPVKA